RRSPRREGCAQWRAVAPAPPRLPAVADRPPAGGFAALVDDLRLWLAGMGEPRPGADSGAPGPHHAALSPPPRGARAGSAGQKCPWGTSPPSCVFLQRLLALFIGTS